MEAIYPPEKDQRGQFESIFPSLVRDLKEDVSQYNMPAQTLDWYEESLQYNTIGGKYNRGLYVPESAYQLLGRPLNTDEYTATATLGWFNEMLQAFFLVSDDIMDSSHTRRGQPCWFRQPKVGMIAINDAFMLESSIYVLLKKHFKSHPRYIDMVELFHDSAFKTELGQTCDLLTAPEDVVDLSKFSLDKHRFIVIYKTAYYSFYLPIALALLYLDMATPENLKQSHDILIPIGEYFQVQDDYLDCYGTPEQIGKIGTDIMDNKCSWLINQALARANEQQRKVLDECYGRKDGEMEVEVKAIFNELQLDKVYEEYQERTVETIKGMIKNIDEKGGLKRSLFEAVLARIYKRNK